MCENLCEERERERKSEIVCVYVYREKKTRDLIYVFFYAPDYSEPFHEKGMNEPICTGNLETRSGGLRRSSLYRVATCVFWDGCM